MDAGVGANGPGQVFDERELNRSRPREAGRGLTISLGAYWHRIALAAILALSAVLDFFGLSGEGYNNEYYAAAVKSMSESWHAFFFNSFDPAGFVTIDKPPLGFWFQVASVKLFAFNGVPLLLPQALAGVLSVVLLYSLVSRTFGRVAGLIAALALAVTPISVVTNRNNTIDSTLVLFVLLGAWAVLRAAETGKMRWLLLCAVFVGLGFNIKMLQAYLVVPAFGLVYLLGTHKRVWRRITDVTVAMAVLLAISLSWVVAVDLTPAGQRPWVDSTSTNSALDLAIGYNGLQRLTGNRPGGAGGLRSGPLAGSPAAAGTVPGVGSSWGGQGAVSGAGNGASGSGPNAIPNRFGGPAGNGRPGGVGENGPTGALRLLDTQLGSQIGWLLPLAVLGLLIGLWQTRKRFQILDNRQRSLVLWGMWLLTTGIFFSVALFFHTYYLVMTAPAVSALAGIAVVSLWHEYRRPGSKTWWLLPLSLLFAAGAQAYLLRDYPAWARWLTPLVAGGCVLAALALIALRVRPVARLGIVAAALGVTALLAPPAAWAAYTVQHTQTGPIVRAGPATASSRFGPGGFAGGFRGGAGGLPGFVPPSNGAVNGPGNVPASPLGAVGPPNFPGSAGGRDTGRTFGWPFGRRGFDGGPDGRADSALITFLLQHRGGAKFLVATPSSNEAAPIIIATGAPVMSLGGFSGSDPILTPAKLAALAKQGVVRYFLLGGRGPGGPDRGSSLTSWIEQHSRQITVAGTEIYEYTG